MSTSPQTFAGRHDSSNQGPLHPRDGLPVLELDDFGRYREVRPGRSDCYLAVLIARQRHQEQESGAPSTVEPSVFWG